jgi:hypothetical protein
MEPNHGGFKAFISRIPAAYLAAITSVEIEIPLDFELWSHATKIRARDRLSSIYLTTSRTYKSNLMVSNFMIVIRALAKHFTSLRNLTIRYSGERAVYISYTSENVKVLEQGVKMLSKLEKLKKVDLIVWIGKTKYNRLVDVFGKLDKEVRAKRKRLHLPVVYKPWRRPG